jgi:hypothetical protein
MLWHTGGESNELFKVFAFMQYIYFSDDIDNIKIQNYSKFILKTLIYNSKTKQHHSIKIE